MAAGHHAILPQRLSVLSMSLDESEALVAFSIDFLAATMYLATYIPRIPFPTSAIFAILLATVSTACA